MINLTALNYTHPVSSHLRIRTLQWYTSLGGLSAWHMPSESATQGENT